MKLSHQDAGHVKHDDDGFDWDAAYIDWFYAELAKADRGEKAMVRRGRDVIFKGRANSNVILLIPNRVPPAKEKPKGNGKAPNEINGGVRELALDYIQQGWDVMRLRPKSKEPYKEDDWGKPSKPYAITNDNISTLREDENLAIVFSTAGSLKDIDLDYQEAADLAEAVGMGGAAFGRKSVIGHYLYDAPGCEAKKFELPRLPEGSSYPRELPLHDGKASRIVMEIRGNDHTYTMVPPSVHPCGERLAWVGTKREPPKMTAKELRALAGRHAFASVVLYFYPADDATAAFEVRMALTGALIRSGMPADLVTTYVQGVARLAGDPKWKEDFAKRTEKLINEGKKATGLTKLLEVLALPSQCLDVFYEWLNVVDDETLEGDAPKYEMPEREWPVLDPAALHGLTGEVVEVIGPHTESDMVALVMQFHIAFGNAIGRSAYYQVEGTEHFTNLYGVLAGKSSKSRKGTSGDRIQQLMSTALAIHSGAWEQFTGSAGRWVTERIQSGLSSGEGVIWAIRDEVSKEDKNGETQIVVDGVDDKRLLLDEREFAQCLAVMKRDGSTASIVVRKGWDGKPLGNLTKNSPAKCEEPHISICGHITNDELRSSLDQVSMASGYANRFLFACVKRSKLLPFGGDLQQDALDALAKKVKTAYDKAWAIKKRFDWDTKARALWEKVYSELSAETPGLLGAICGRAEAQTIRLALIYAVLDGSDGIIKLQHLEAALALWKYYETSVLYIFGDSLGDPVADTILASLRQNPGGMTRTQISDLFGRNQNSNRINAALTMLLTQGKAASRLQPHGNKAGRPIEVWEAV